MRWLIILLFMLLPLQAAAKKYVAQPEDVDSITVLAPSSFSVPITELCRLYSLKTAQDVNAVYDSAAVNINNIEAGDPADIVIIPSRKFFAELNNKGLIEPATTTVIARDTLSIVASKQMNVASSYDAKIALNNVYNKTLMVIADEETDALGEYTVQALAKLGMWDKFRARVVIAPNSSSVVDLIIKGQSAGIVYTSDAKLYSQQLNTVAVIPSSMHKPIEYLASVVVGKDMAKAKGFLAYLSSKEGKDIFRKYGFVIQ